MADVPLYRLTILRAYYALMAFGTMAVFWPLLLSHSDAWGAANGAQYSLLCALTVFSLWGLVHPLKMLPIILYEFVWKCLWFGFVAAPLWLHDQMTEQVWSNVFACSVAVVLTPLVVPWPYFWKTYVTGRADRWRAGPATSAVSLQ